MAEENIRANKTIEDTPATQQKQELAAEAVGPEYTYQEEIASEQQQLVNRLFDMVEKVRDDSAEENERRREEATDDDAVEEVTEDEKVAAMNEEIEQTEEEELSFYQQIPRNFYRIVFSLDQEELTQVQEETLDIVEQRMTEQVRQADLNTARQDAQEQVETLDISNEQKEAVSDLMNEVIVVNTFLNEQRTEELRQEAEDSVQPVMIYQGEIIVREGSQIDSNAIQKLNVLGMTEQTQSFFPFIAIILVALLQIAVLYYFTHSVKNKDKRENQVVFYVVAMTLSLLFMKFFQLFQTEVMAYIPLFFPAAFIPVVLNLFVNRRSGILAAAFQVVLAAFIFYEAAGTNVLPIILLSYMFSGLMGTLLPRRRISHQGKQSMLWIVVFPFLISLTIFVLQGVNFADSQTWIALACSLTGSVLSLLMGVGLYQFIELMITDDSDIVLNELSNPNHTLLKKLLEEAPGTYHHSMMVANLSANAVAEIGGNTLLTRVACYYHDIGKLKHANFFVENLPQEAENPHNFLLPEDSKQIIFGHVTDGVKVLEQEKMPQMVIDICQQHHGTTLMKFFYSKAKERNSEVTEEEFRYPGPNPQTREAGVVSIADSCEAAVRAMENPTNEKIDEFVSNLITDRMLDGQLDDTQLTLKELKIIKKSLINGLCSTFHSRIKYPKMKSEAEKMKEEQERSGQ
ncbi:HDIG domain-containing protein [Tetragenococcus muriaticus]|uniref:HD superfamily hydrolase n=1 Tax=Tetragenococcus muriaticus 3MR10-3 TaxID=1302648 RepID=A0A091C196_9ENTE|nr:HD superfamily hydrolase [Tetragenococcus muriaticus 3MR10-3]GMA45784.1 HDIG domain-containing protein [Tetragenococcus muriaticus]GMA46845.1 HDIG domain-containing protein [Tetragenococcus muriaticus]